VKKGLFLFILLFSFVAESRAGLSKQESIAEIFLVLPQKYKIGLFETANQDVLNASKGRLQTSDRFTSVTVDLKNDYISMGNLSEGTFEMAVWRTKDKRTVTVGVFSTECGPACTYRTFEFLRYDGRSFQKVTDKIFPRISEKMYEIAYRRKGVTDPRDCWTRYEIPRVGTTIEVTCQFSDTVLFRYKWSNGKFILEPA
jgi:hypothetical protein